MRAVLSVIAILCGCASTLEARQSPPLVEAVRAVAPDAIDVRHRLHANPELGNRETETAALIAARLESLGLEVRTGIAHTGVVGVLEGGRPGPVIAVRADMDALPVLEESGLPFASTATATYRGETVPVAHACGHDIHMAVQLGVAALLSARRAELAGTVLFVFQPAEEGPPVGEEGGAPLMLEEGVFDALEPEAIFALHTDPALPVGEVGWSAGPTWASVDHFLIDVDGRQSHGAAPHLSVDPVVMSAEAILAFQSIVSRTLDPLEPAVLTVGIVDGGARYNIIPDQVQLEGTVRSYSEEVQSTIERRMHEILAGIAAAHGGSYAMDYLRITPPTINDDALSAWARPVLVETLGAERVIDKDPEMAGEDFAFFALAHPGFYFRLGVEDPAHPSGGLHTPTFRASDDAIPVGIEAMTALLLRYLEDHAPGE